MHRWECLGKDTLLGYEDTLVEERERDIEVKHVIEREDGGNDSCSIEIRTLD